MTTMKALVVRGEDESDVSEVSIQPLRLHYVRVENVAVAGVVEEVGREVKSSVKKGRPQRRRDA